MIRWVDELPELSGHALPVQRIRAWWQCYGNVSFIRYYIGEQGSVAAVMDGQALAYAVQDEREEVSLFLSMQPDIGFVLADMDTTAAVADVWNTATTEIPVMRCTTPQTELLTESLSPRVLYAFLQPIFPSLPPFDVWYPDVCYRERHGFCRNIAYLEKGQPVSAAMTVAEWDGGALIGGVATAPTHRRRGLASQCVGSLTARLQQQGRQVYICPKNEEAQRVYTDLGFSVCDRVAVTERK